METRRKEGYARDCNLFSKVLERKFSVGKLAKFTSVDSIRLFRVIAIPFYRGSPCLKISIGSGATVPILRSEGNFDSITRYVRQTWWLDKIVQKSLQEIFITTKRKWNGGVSGYL